MMKKRLTLLLSFVLCLALSLCMLTACGKVTIELDATAEVTVGKTVTLVANASDGSEITFSSDNEAVATVGEKNGRVMGVSAGTAVITATAGKAKATCTVTVKDAVKFTFKDGAGATLTDKVDVDRDGTLQLVATASDGSTITEWSSNDPSVATVDSNGLVTGMFDGETTIVVRTATGTGSITVNIVDKAPDKYLLTSSAEAGKWWYALSTEGSRSLESKRHEYRNSAVSFEFGGTGNWYWSDVQLGLKKDNSLENGWYEVSAKIKSSVDCTVTVHKDPVHLNEGENEIRVRYEQTDNSAESFYMYFYVEGSGGVDSARVDISDLKWTPVTVVDLMTPSFTLVGDTVTTTDEVNKEGVREYQVGLFKDADATEPVHAHAIKKEDVINTDNFESSGEFIVRVKACGYNGFTDSPWTTDSSVKYTVEAKNVSYDMNGGADSAMSSGKWECWTGDGGSKTEAKYNNGTITFKGKNSNWAFYGIQFFRHYTKYAKDSSIKLSMHINSNVSGKITVNGSVFEIKEGEQDVEWYVTAGSPTISMQLGANGQDAGTWLGVTKGEGDDNWNIADIDLTISDISISSFVAEKLAAPTVAVAEKVVTITDETNDAANVSGYQVGFFKEGSTTPVATANMKSGDEIDDSKIVDGVYSLKVRALSANAQYTASDWSEGVEYTVAHGEIKYETYEPSYDTMPDTVTGEGDTAANTWGLWWVAGADWSCGTVVNMGAHSIDAENKEISVTYSGGSVDFCVQLFYNNPNIVAGQKYKLSVTVNASAACEVTINKEVKQLVAGDNAIEIEFTQPAAGGNNYQAYNMQMRPSTEEITMKISNVSWTELAA